MLSLFKNIRFSSAVLIFIWGLLIRIPFLIEIPVKGTSLIPWIEKANSVFQNYYWISVILAYLIVYVSAMVYNKICIDQDVLYQHTYLPGFFMVTFSALYSSNVYLDSSHFALFFLTFAVSNLFKLYQTESTHGILYNISALVCLAGFALPGLFVLIFYIPIAVMVLKKINLKDLLAIIMGFATPLILYFGLSYIFKFNLLSIPKLVLAIDSINWHKFQNLFAILAVYILSIIAIFKALSNFRKNTIKTRRINLMILSLLVFCTLLLLINFKYLADYHIITLFATAPLVSYLFLGNKRRIWKEISSVVLIIIILLSLYGVEIKL